MARLAYKFRLYPTRQQVAHLEHSLDLCRELYNGAIRERRDAWALNRIRVTCFDQIYQIPAIRVLRPDLRTVQARVLHQTLRQVDKTFQAFFRRVKAGQKPGYPRFKSRDRFNSFFYNQYGFKFIDGKLQLGDIGLIKIRQHRDIEGTIKEVTVKRENSKWFAIASCDNVPVTPLAPSTEQIGIDVGIESFATLSDGTQIDNWRYYESSAKKLRVAQRRVTRRKKGFNGRRKAVAALRKIHQKVANQRADFQHKLSTALVRQFGMIAVEKLNTQRMCKGILSKQIHDVSWSSFFQKLRYKAANAGRELIEVDPRGTSQTCVCGATVQKDLSVRAHYCPECGLSEHRDIVSAKIILQRAEQVLKDLTWPVAASVSLEAR